jgi:hypothetical protein
VCHPARGPFHPDFCLLNIEAGDDPRSSILFCLIGSYSVNLRVIDMIVMLIFGVFDYFMQKFEYDGGPFILAFILGPLLETALRQSLIISHGGLGIFVTRPPALAALLIALLFLAFPLIPAIRIEGKIGRIGIPPFSHRSFWFFFAQADAGSISTSIPA